MKALINKVVLENIQAVLFLEDHQLFKPEFFELINSLIASGEIPGLYTPEELEPILQQLQDEMSNVYHCRTVFEYFLWKVSYNLRIAISLDAKHPNFGLNLSQNPALTTRCSIIWADKWS